MCKYTQYNDVFQCIMTLNIDRQIITKYSLDYYRDISWRINLRANCDTKLYPQTDVKIDSHVFILVIIYNRNLFVV